MMYRTPFGKAKCLQGGALASGGIAAVLRELVRHASGALLALHPGVAADLALLHDARGVALASRGIAAVLWELVRHASGALLALHPGVAADIARLHDARGVARRAPLA